MHPSTSTSTSICCPKKMANQREMKTNERPSSTNIRMFAINVRARKRHRISFWQYLLVCCGFLSPAQCTVSTYAFVVCCMSGFFSSLLLVVYCNAFWTTFFFVSLVLLYSTNELVMTFVNALKSLLFLFRVVSPFVCTLK